MMRESDVLREVLLAIGALRGVQAWRTAAVACYLPDGRGGWRLHRPLPPGWPDITAVVRGRALGIEVKAPRLRRKDGTAPLRPVQDTMRSAWVAAGGTWATVTSAAEALAAVEAMR